MPFPNTLELDEIYGIAIQVVDKKSLAQCRGTNCLRARNLSRCRIFIACKCANPGAGLCTGPGKWLKINAKSSFFYRRRIEAL